MADATHNESKEAFEDGINRGLFWSGHQIAQASITTAQKFVTHDDGTISAPAYNTAVKFSDWALAAFKAYEASQQPTPPPVDPEPPSDPVEPPPPADTSGVQPPASAGWKGVTGLQVIPPSYPATPPAVGQCMTDPTTGADQYALDDENGSLIVYSRYPPTSCDGKMLLVHGMDSTSCRIKNLVDLSTYRQLTDDSGRSIGEVNEIRWDYNDPSIIRYVKGMQFWQQNIVTGENTLIRDFAAAFPDGDLLQDDVEGDSSHDSRYWCWQVKKIPSSGSYYAVAFITYDAQEDKILGVMDFSNWGLPQGATTPTDRMPTPNMVEVSPDGRFALIDWNRCWGEGSDPNTSRDANLVGTHADGPHCYPLDLDVTKAVKVGVDATHSGWAQNSEGEWGLASQNNRDDYMEWCSPDGPGWHEDGTGVVRMLKHAQLGYGAGDPRDSVGMHFGKFLHTPGYAVMSTYSLISSEPGDNQIMILPIETDCTPIRVCPSNNNYRGNYRDEGSAAVGADGLTFFWTSNLNQFDDAGNAMHRVPVAMKLPADWQTRIRAA